MGKIFRIFPTNKIIKFLRQMDPDTNLGAAIDQTDTLADDTNPTSDEDEQEYSRLNIYEKLGHSKWKVSPQNSKTITQRSEDGFT